MIKQIIRRIGAPDKFDPCGQVDCAGKINPVIGQVRIDTAISLRNGLQKRRIITGGRPDQIAKIEQWCGSKREFPVEDGSDRDVARLARDQDVGETRNTPCTRRGSGGQAVSSSRHAVPCVVRRARSQRSGPRRSARLVFVQEPIEQPRTEALAAIGQGCGDLEVFVQEPGGFIGLRRGWSPGWNRANGPGRVARRASRS